MKKLVIGGLIFIAGIASASYFYFVKEKQPIYFTEKVKRGEIVEEVSATGKIKPSQKVELQFKNPGKIKNIFVKVGDKVKIGQKLIILDNSLLYSQLAKAKASLQAAQANLEKLLKGATPEEIAIYEAKVENAKKAVEDAKLAVNEAETQLANARQNLEDKKSITETNLKNAYDSALVTIDSCLLTIVNALNTNDKILDDPDAQDVLSVLNFQNLIDANTKRTLAKTQYEKALSLYESAQSTSDYQAIDKALEAVKVALSNTSDALAKTNDVLYSSITSSSFPETQLDTYKSEIAIKRTEVNSALSSLNASIQNIKIIKETNEAELNQAEAQVKTAEAQLELAKNEVSLAEGNLETALRELEKIKAPPTQETIDLYQAQIKQQKAQISYILAQINENILISPINGIVSEINGEVGEIVKIGIPVISLIDDSAFQLEADIPEADIAKVKINDPCEITLDALPNETFHGKVISINPDKEVIAGVIYYKVKVSFDKISPKIKSGMSADLIIKTAFRKNVLFIPSRAIHERNGSFWVKVLKEGEIEERKIKPGIKGSDGVTEIIEGLQEGEEVIVFIKK